MKKLLFLCLILPLCAQEPPPFRGGPRGPGPGGPGGMREDRKLVKQFDRDGDKRLNLDERKAAREFLAKEPEESRGPRARGFRGGGGGGAPGPGEKISPSDVKNYPDTPFYDLGTLRTAFLEFESADWYKELVDFNSTDVEVPAKLVIDGTLLKDVGVHFRGASSFFMLGEGQKRSLNLDLDFVHDGQNTGGYRTLNLLNSHGDPSHLRTVLFCQIAREYIPAPKANFLRVVINGENWGVFVNAQQFNKDFINENFGTPKGARWKVPGSPRANGGLAYLGEEVAAYKRSYEIKTKDDPKSWSDLIRLCRVLNETAPEQLERELAPILNIDGVLRFLALENALINSDGYWIRSSDYNIYQDESGKFHLIPHDANETFAGAQGPGRRGGDGSPYALNPMQGANDSSKPLLSKLLVVPSLRERYFGYIRHIAENWLDWEKLGPVAVQHHTLIADEVKRDTKKLDSTEAFLASIDQEGGRRPSIKTFAGQRRAYLLSLPEVRDAPLPIVEKRN